MTLDNCNSKVVTLETAVTVVTVVTVVQLKKVKLPEVWFPVSAKLRLGSRLNEAIANLYFY